MTVPPSRPISALFATRLVGSVAVVTVGVGINAGLESPYRLVPALLLIAVGVAGVTDAVRDDSVDRLRLVTRCWWAVAFGAFLPYALVSAPASDSAAAVGEPFAGPLTSLVLSSVAGALVCCAVAVTVLYGFARYGIHPGRPSPEERVLPGERND